MQPQYQPQYAPPAPAQPYQPPMSQYPPAPAAYAPPAPSVYAPPAPAAYPQQYAPAPAASPPPPGTLDQFFSQPSTGGGPSLKFMDPTTRQPMIGRSYEGIVARPITDADVQAQTNNEGQVQTYPDGRPKYLLKIPLKVQPTQEFPDGLAQWYVKGQARDELARAMAEAGAPVGVPEHGAWIRVTLVGTRPIPGRNPMYQYRVEYRRPAGAPPASDSQEALPQQVSAPVAPAQQVSAPVAPAAPAQQESQPPLWSAPAPQQSAPVPQQPAPAADPRLAQLTPEQQQLLASLTGGTAG